MCSVFPAMRPHPARLSVPSLRLYCQLPTPERCAEITAHATRTAPAGTFSAALRTDGPNPLR